MSETTSDFVALQVALAGEYSLERELGRGGMGIVYLARDVQLDRRVAIKVLPTHFTDASIRERFVREARTAAALSHPHIVPIHRVGEAGGFVFFVMSYVPGRTLGERLRTDGPLPPAEVSRILREVAWALEHAHQHGIVHRDVKPDNILLEESSGRALVTDFGIAFTGTTDGPDTDPGRVMGTAQFMSPEQAAGESVDGRSDMYALGVVGYLAVSGRFPFEAKSAAALLLRQATMPATPLSRAAPGVPSELALSIDRCLAARPEERMPDGKTLADALQPRADAARPLPPALRSWLRAKNPAQPVFIGMYAIAAVTAMRNFVAVNVYHIPMPPEVWVYPGILAIVPILPLLGYQLTQARVLFRSGYSLNDLRRAIAVEAAEREEEQAYDEKKPFAPGQRILQYTTFAWAILTIASLGRFGIGVDAFTLGANLVGIIGSLVLLAASNMFSVPLFPAAIRHWRPRLRDRLWSSRPGAWLARMLGAPNTSGPLEDGVFRPTEVVLGDAAGELFAALPTADRKQLADLPAIVETLEARAAEARARLDHLEQLAVSGMYSELSDAPDGRSDARHALTRSVAALESIRLDLLRLHAGATDLSSLTTLLDAAAALGEDVGRMVAANEEVGKIAPRRPNRLRPISTPV